MRKTPGKIVRRAEREFYIRCRDILVDRLRPRWEGTSAQLRRRVAELLRARRNDITWLRRTSRLALASSAFAVALIGAGAGRQASAAPFQEVTGGQNPLNGATAGGYPNCSFVDINNDGDMDAFITQNSTAVTYYRNNGSPTNPNFGMVTGSGNPLNGLFIKDLTFGDIDNDGDFDMFCGASTAVRFFENLGNASSPNFMERTGAQNPMNGLVAANSVAQPFLVDIDADSDLDMFVGSQNGTIKYFRNDGTVSSPTFVEQTGGNNPLDGSLGTFLVGPEFADMDLDGDYDAVVGGGDGSGDTLIYFRNDGIDLFPFFNRQDGGANPFNSFTFGYPRLGLVDINNDTDIDVFVVENAASNVTYLRNNDPSVVPTATPTATPSPDPTPSPSSTPLPTTLPTTTPTPTSSPSPAPSPSPFPTATASPNPSPTPLPVNCPAGLVNAGFETSDYSGWTLFESSGVATRGTWGNASSGEIINAASPKFDFFDMVNVNQVIPTGSVTYNATEGARVAFQHAAGAETHRMYQDVYIDAAAVALELDMRYRNFGSTFSAASQSLAVHIRDTADTILETLFITTDGVDPLEVASFTTYSFDISAYSGMTVRIDVTMIANLQLFHAAFDNFRIKCDALAPTPTPLPTVTSTPSPDPTPTPTASPDPTATPTASPEPSASPEPTPSPDPSATATSTPSPAATATASASPEPTPSPDATSTPTAPPCCPGDANNSGSFVDANDFIAVQANFGADNGVGGPGDANCSGSFVDANDFIAVQANFGADCG